MELLIGLMVIGGVIIGVIVSTYNGIVERKNSCKRSWSDVVVYSQQKLKVLPKLEEKLKEYKDFEGSTLSDITKLRTEVNQISTKEINPQLLEKIDAHFESAVRGIKVTAENYPDLKSSTLFSQVMSEISSLQENITASITIFNQNVELFNNGIQHFPNSLINSLINKEKEIDSFNHKESESDIGFKPNL